MSSSHLYDPVSDFVVTQGYGIKGLVDNGLKTVPEKYIKPLEERVDMRKVIKENSVSIPIIDVSYWDTPQVAKSICDAAEKWGFFQIINHGVPVEILEKVQIAAHRFFELPIEEKKKYLRDGLPKNKGAGFVQFGTSFNPLVEDVLEWKDFLTLLHVPGDDSASACWPSICRDQILEYMNRCESIIEKLLQILMKRLNVQEIDDTRKRLLMGSIKVKMNYYPICPNPELTAGVGRHSDISSFTVLLQDDTGGLYVRGMDGDRWVHVKPIRNSLVINIGDALEIMSNGIYKSIEHYVAANRSKNRVSVPIFVDPAIDAVIGPLPEVLELCGGKPIYRDVIFSDYMKHLLSKGHDGKQTLEFARI